MTVLLNMTLLLYLTTYTSFGSLVKNCNHKGLGIYYLMAAFIFGISGTLLSVLMRIELYSSGNRVIAPENQNYYNISITLHGLLMIFFLVMPALFGGFGNYLLPVLLGAPEVAYPRVNNFSIIVLFLSYLLVIVSLVSEFGGGTGWTLYPPLSTSFMSLSLPYIPYFPILGLLLPSSHLLVPTYIHPIPISNIPLANIHIPPFISFSYLCLLTTHPYIST